MFRLFLAFTLIPVLELMLLVRLGGQIGLFPTLGICILTGVVGASLARSQGLSVLRRMQETSARGELPARELVDGVMILVAGVVLLTPGFLTDAVGILLLLPPVRALIRHVLAKRMTVALNRGSWHATVRTPGHDGAGPESAPQPAWGADWPELPPDQEIYAPGSVPTPPSQDPPQIFDVDP